MRRTFWTLGLLAAFLPGPFLSVIARPAVAADATLPPEERAYVASTLYAALLQNFAHPAPGLESAYQAYLHEAMHVSDRRGFDLATMAFLAGLHNGHTYFYDQWLDRQDHAPLGFKLERRAEGYVVTASERKSLRVGDRVVALDGRPIADAIASIGRYMAASSERGVAYGLFEDWQPYLFPAKFMLRLADGREVEIDRHALLPARPVRHTAARWLEPGRIAYLSLPAFDDPRFEAEALAALSRFKLARALVVDVRGNDGGASPSRLVAALMNRPYRSMAFTTRVHVGLVDALASSDDASGSLASLAGAGLTWSSPWYAPAPDAFTGRLYFLTDGWCYSACETFLAAFKDNHRGLLVGERTRGSTGQTYIRELPNGMGFHIGAKHARMPDGSPFEGVGIAPDVPVSPSAEDLAHGKDVVLERAIALAHEGR